MAQQKRNLDTLIKGKECPITTFTQRQSNFLVNNEKPMKLLTHFTDPDLNMQFYTFMPAQYDNKTAEDLQELITKLTTPGKGRLVYYGQIGKANIVETLFGDEGVNNNKLEGIMKIEAQVSGSPRKRGAPEESNIDNSKKSKV